MSFSSGSWLYSLKTFQPVDQNLELVIDVPPQFANKEEFEKIAALGAAISGVSGISLIILIAV